MRKLLFAIVCLGLSIAPELSAAEDSTTAAALASGKPDSVSTNAWPALKLKSTKIYFSGALHSSLVSIDTGKEFIGLTVPVRYQYRSADHGQEIMVYLDSGKQSWVRFRFETNAFADFTHAAVWPLISDSFSGSPPVFSSSFADGRKVLGFTAKTGSTSNPRQVRYQAVQYQSGTLLISTTAYGSSADLTFFGMKQLVAALQFAKAEKDLKRLEPSRED